MILLRGVKKSLYDVFLSKRHAEKRVYLGLWFLFMFAQWRNHFLWQHMVWPTYAYIQEDHESCSCQVDLGHTGTHNAHPFCRCPGHF